MLAAGRAVSLAGAIAALFGCTAMAEPLSLQVTAAQLGYDARTSQPLVNFEMSESARQAFSAFTTQNVGRAVELRIDGKTMHKTVVREPIVGGRGQIPMSNVEEAKDIAARLSAGTARLEIEPAAQ
jgi:preprotein translocase subunit SecD